MRCFIAVDIDDDIRSAIRDVQDDLRERSGLKKYDAKWVDPELMHITLKFLGDVPDKEIMRICQIVTEVAGRHESFGMRVKGLGTFGRPARVLWAGSAEDGALNDLQRELDEKLSVEGFPLDNKKFSGHLTLCRIKSSKAASVLCRLVERFQDTKFGPLYVDSVCVYRSDLTKEGPEYTLMHRASLK